MCKPDHSSNHPFLFVIGAIVAATVASAVWVIEQFAELILVSLGMLIAAGVAAGITFAARELYRTRGSFWTPPVMSDVPGSRKRLSTESGLGQSQSRLAIEAPSKPVTVTAIRHRGRTVRTGAKAPVWPSEPVLWDADRPNGGYDITPTTTPR
jgi:hypothetical protein